MGLVLKLHEEQSTQTVVYQLFVQVFREDVLEFAPEPELCRQVHLLDEDLAILEFEEGVTVEVREVIR